MKTRADRRQATQNRIKAMSHPVRAEAFRLIRDRGPISPAQIARDLGAKVEDVSYHVRKLKEFNCAEEVFSRPVRGATEHFYRATDAHMLDTEEWGELAEEEPAMAEALVDETMQYVLDDFACSRRARIVGNDEEFHTTRTPHQLDAQGLQDALKASEEWRIRMLEIAEESLERGGDLRPISASLLLFKMPFRR